MDVKEDYSICRTCLSEEGNMRDIFNIAEIVMNCAPIQIQHGDGLPTTICSECVTQINQFYDFRLICEQSDFILRKKLFKEHFKLNKSNRFENESPETEISSDTDESEEDPLNYLNDSENKFEETQEIATNERCTNSKRKDVNKQNAVEHENKIEEQIKQNIESQINDVAEPVNAENSSKEEEIATNKRKRCRKSKRKESVGNSSGKEVTSKKLSCKYCNIKFTKRFNLEWHEQKHREGLKCHLCGKEFTIVKSYTDHIKKHNRIKGSHLCPTCGKTFTLKENLVHHLKIHSGVKPHKCDQCDKTFITPKDLRTHLVTHSSEKPHLCNICGSKFARLMSLRTHLKKIHTITQNLRPYVCTVCGKSFQERRCLTRHMVVHTGERSHICGVCGKAFNRNSILRVHEKIHNGVKPHVCPVCKRGFIQKHVLVTHMKTHPQTGNNPGINQPEQTADLE